MNYEAGAKTPMAAVFAALSLAAILLLIAPLTAYLPIAAMAGVLLVVAYGLVDFHHIRTIVRTSTSEAAVLAVTFLAALLVELEFAIYVGVILSLLLYLNRTSHPNFITLAPEPDSEWRSFINTANKPVAECPQLKIIRIDGSLFFGAVDHFAQELRAMTRSTPEQAHILIVGSGINFIDSSFIPLVDHKEKYGILSKIISLDDIYSGVFFQVKGRDDAERIKYFIKNSVEQWGVKYVMLVGGKEKMPVRYSVVPSYNEMKYKSDFLFPDICSVISDGFLTDLYYADIYDENGSFCSWDSNENNIFGEYNYLGRTDFVDLHPDVCLGRLSFRGLNEVSGVVNKIISYESTGAYMENWFSNFLVCGGDTFPDYGNIEKVSILIRMQLI